MVKYPLYPAKSRSSASPKANQVRQKPQILVTAAAVRIDRATRGASKAISRSAPVGGFLKPTKYNPEMPVSSPNRFS
jgi:hypothetical protein